MQNYENLIFPVQNIPLVKKQLAYDKIKELDEAIESGRLPIQKLSDQELPGVLTKLTFLYGKWVCNFQCPSYCYTKNFSTYTLTNAMILKMIRFAQTAGIQFTYWPGVGEITLLPDFWEIMKFQAERGLPAIVFTNGSVFIDEKLCQSSLGISRKELHRWISAMPQLYFYVKMWSTQPEVARKMTGTKGSADYPYVQYENMMCPIAFAELHSMLGNRIGFQCMVTQKNYQDYVENILPFCSDNAIPLFAEPVILSGNAYNNKQVASEQLTEEQLSFVGQTFASGGSYCEKRQYGEMMIIGDKMSPGIAIPPREEDCLMDANGCLKPLDQVYFNDYFRMMRKKSDALNGCLCRSYWHEKQRSKD